MNTRFALLLALGLTLTLQGLQAQPAADLKQKVTTKVAAETADLVKLYQHLHANPELSFQEEKTAQRIAEELKKAGFEVTTKVGGHGVVGVLKNGSGPTLMLRTDLDALPVPEQTGLPYASKVKTVDPDGKEVPVMHACGHDVHMTSFIGTARVMSALKDQWKGTLVVIGQPAEEKGGGARAMLKDGLFKRFPKPEKVVALHVASDMAVGTVGYVPGFALANVDSVDITIRGVGGHGAYPHGAKDPIVLAAQTVIALQTIVSREISPTESAVVTVGSIHGGTKHNIIPDEVTLQLTLRSYTDQVRAQTIAAIKRITENLAKAAGVPEDRMPIVKFSDEYTPACYNDPALTRRLAGVVDQWLGKGAAIERQPVMGGEDFSEYGRTEDKIPISMLWLGVVNPEVVKKSMQEKKALPTIHSPFFAPAAEPSIKSGVTAMSGMLLDLFNNK
ncbi:MAG TPA: amidohydrolase [Verrucomicrobiae bacterium]